MYPICKKPQQFFAGLMKDRGYVLLDVLAALFFFAIGFGILFGLNEAAVRESNQAIHLIEAANIAQETMEKLAANSWQENISLGRCIPGIQVQGAEGAYNWAVKSLWDNPQGLLRVSVVVEWMEQGKKFSYTLETLYDTTQ